MDEMTRAREVKRRHDAELMAIEGVQGVAVSLEQGRPVIQVFLQGEEPERRERVPEMLEGVPVRIVRSTGFEAR